MAYPDESIQSLVQEWWVPQSPKKIERGALILFAVPFVDVVPQVLSVRARTSDRDHTSAEYEMRAFNINTRYDAPTKELPVAAVPQRPKEVQLVYRAKIRPGVIVGVPQQVPQVPQGTAKWITSKVMLVAPSFGVDHDGTRGGWPDLLVNSVWRCQHPQYVCDQLPHDTDVKQSVICLDRLLPVCTTPGTFSYLGFKLSEDAMAILEDWMCWCRTGTLAEKGLLALAQREFAAL